MSDSRKQYWNKNYFEYFKERVSEANRGTKESGIIENDSAIPDNRSYFDAIGLLDLGSEDAVLEMGCGFGRSIPYLAETTKKVHAVDISDEMIGAAKESYGHLNNVTFDVSEAENLPFPDHSFQKIICFGVFDALYQRQALLEMNRILAMNGCVLITGKNDDYFDDDDKAFVAECNAREKKHPNFFTDVSLLINVIGAFGFEILVRRFYQRRGDMGNMDYVEQLPPHHYEYMLVLRKTNDASENTEPNISNSHSKAHHRRTVEKR